MNRTRVFSTMILSAATAMLMISGAFAEETVVVPQLKILCGDKCSKTGEMRKPESDSVTKALLFSQMVAALLKIF